MGAGDRELGGRELGGSKPEAANWDKELGTGNWGQGTGGRELELGQRTRGRELG